MMQDAWSLSVWLPALVVLGVGIVTAALMVFRLRGGASGATAEATDAADAEKIQDLQLEIADLETRRDELYLRLRGELEDAELSETERSTLENAAARTLRDLDDAKERLAAFGVDSDAKSASAAEKASESSADATPAPGRGPSPVAAFGFGVGLTALVAVLFFWATQDAKQGPRDGPAPRGLERSPEVSGRPAGGGEMPSDHPPVEGQIPPELAARIEAMEMRLAADANDVAARKELGLTQVQAGLLMEAFENANVLLQGNAGDPDALYIHSVVRLAMGQSEQAVELADRVLASYPDHLLALMVRGAALLRMNDRDGAVATWEQALELTGGSHPDIEFLIQQALAGVGGMVPAAPPPPAAPAVDPSTVYTVDIDMTPGTTSRGVLFLSVRPDPASPPIAVKRIDNPRFPITLTLGPNDSMMGQALPESGVVRAKLDADGSVATDSPGDLRGEAQGSVGGRIAIVLGE